MSTRAGDPRLLAGYYLEEDYQGPEAPVTIVARALLDAVNEIERLRAGMRWAQAAMHPGFDDGEGEHGTLEYLRRGYNILGDTLDGKAIPS